MDNPYEPPNSDSIPESPSPGDFDLNDPPDNDGGLSYLNDDDWDESMTELCICCVRPYNPLAIFCPRCAAPVSSLSTMMPYERILAEGFVLRRAAEKPANKLVVIGLFLLGMLNILYLPVAIRSAFNYINRSEV